MSKPKKSQIVFYSCLAFLAGVTTRVFVDLPLLAVFIAAAVALSLLVIAWPWRWGKAAGFVVLFFALGMFRLAVDLPQAAPANLTNRHDQTLTFTVTPETQLLATDRGQPVIAAILAVKQKFEARLNALLPEPQASFLSGLLLGVRRGLPPDLLEDFQRVGLTHIIAVSGFNITVISAVILAVALGAGSGRRQAFWLVVISLLVFMILTGLSASVIRASIMGFLVVLGQRLGRLINMRASLALSALVMTFINPQVLIYDAGFQLSFLSTIGLVYLAPFMARRVSFLSGAFCF